MTHKITYRSFFWCIIVFALGVLVFVTGSHFGEKEMTPLNRSILIRPGTAAIGPFSTNYCGGLKELRLVMKRTVPLEQIQCLAKGSGCNKLPLVNFSWKLFEGDKVVAQGNSHKAEETWGDTGYVLWLGEMPLTAKTVYRLELNSLRSGEALDITNPKLILDAGRHGVTNKSCPTFTILTVGAGMIGMLVMILMPIVVVIFVVIGVMERLKLAK